LNYTWGLLCMLQLCDRSRLGVEGNCRLIGKAGARQAITSSQEDKYASNNYGRWKTHCNPWGSFQLSLVRTLSPSLIGVCVYSSQVKIDCLKCWTPRRNEYNPLSVYFSTKQKLKCYVQFVRFESFETLKIFKSILYLSSRYQIRTACFPNAVFRSSNLLRSLWSVNHCCFFITCFQTNIFSCCISHCPVRWQTNPRPCLLTARQNDDADLKLHVFSSPSASAETRR